MDELEGVRNQYLIYDGIGENYIGCDGYENLVNSNFEKVSFMSFMDNLNSLCVLFLNATNSSKICRMSELFSNGN